MTINATDSPSGRTWKIELSEKEFFDVVLNGITAALLFNKVPKEAVVKIAPATMMNCETGKLVYDKVDSFTREALREFHRLGIDPNFNVEEFLTP